MNPYIKSQYLKEFYEKYHEQYFFTLSNNISITKKAYILYFYDKNELSNKKIIPKERLDLATILGNIGEIQTLRYEIIDYNQQKNNQGKNFLISYCRNHPEQIKDILKNYKNLCGVVEAFDISEIIPQIISTKEKFQDFINNDGFKAIDFKNYSICPQLKSLLNQYNYTEEEKNKFWLEVLNFNQKKLEQDYLGSTYGTFFVKEFNEGYFSQEAFNKIKEVFPFIKHILNETSLEEKYEVFNKKNKETIHVQIRLDNVLEKFGITYFGVENTFQQIKEFTEYFAKRHNIDKVVALNEKQNIADFFIMHNTNVTKEKYQKELVEFLDYFKEHREKFNSVFFGNTVGRKELLDNFFIGNEESGNEIRVKNKM